MNPNESNIAVKYTAQVIRAGKPVAEIAGKNLVVDGFLNLIGGLTYNAKFEGTTAYNGNRLFATCRFGTGLGPVKRGSGAVTFSFAGSGTVTVTASAGFFVAQDVGRVLKMNTGEEVRITAYTSGTVVTGTIVGANPATGVGSIHYVNDTGLTTPTPSVVPDGSFPNNYVYSGFDTSTGVWGRFFTVDSGAATATTTITEMGWFADNGAMLGRVLLPGVGLGLQIGDIIRVSLYISITFALASVAIGSGGFVGTSRLYGMPTGGQNFDDQIVGGSINLHASALNISAINAAKASGSFASKTVTTTQPTLGEYVCTANFTVSEGNGTIAAFSLNGIHAHNLTTPGVKTNLQTLAVAFRVKFGRTLTN